MPLIDIGANLTSRRFNKDLDATLTRAREAGLAHIIVTGTSLSASRDALALAHSHPGFLSATAGVHPHDAKHWSPDSADALRDLLAESQCVATGECGLDFNRDFSPRDQQKHCFAAQMALAAEVQKPVFLHQRDAHAAFTDVLRAHRRELCGGVVHCFTGSLDEARTYLDMDCYIGITGWLCDQRRGQALRDLVGFIPRERLLIETDAPYLTPHNLPEKPRGNRNEPAFLPYVLTRLAALVGEPEAALGNQIARNTRALFGEL